MKRLLIIGGATLLVTVSAFAQAGPVYVPCNTVSTVSQLLFGNQDFAFDGCSVQDKLFTNFSWASAAVDPSTVAIAALNDPGYPGASNVNIGIEFSGSFIAPAGTSIDIHIKYRVAVTDGSYQIDDGSLTLTGINLHSDTGNITGAEDWCGRGTNVSPTAPCTGINDQSNHVDVDYLASGGFYDVTFNPFVSFVDVDKDISVTGGVTHQTEFSAIDQRFSQTQEAAPEPVSMMLLGSGLVAFGFIGRKLRKK